MKIEWDKIGERLFQTGVEKGILFPFKDGEYESGVPWNGLTAVNESPEGGEPTALYADNIKYLNLLSNEDFKATIEAYTYPTEFEECDGSKQLAQGVFLGQQTRSSFGFSYVSKIGNDTDGIEYGYIIHLIYGCFATPSEKNHSTVNDSPEAATMSWSISTTPISVNKPGAKFKPTAHITIDSTRFTEETSDKLQKLESLLYGADDFSQSKTYSVGDYVTYGTDSNYKTYKCVTAVSSAGQWDASKWSEIGEAGPHLPLPEELIDIFGEVSG